MAQTSAAVALPGPSPLELLGPVWHVPALEDLEDLTDIPDRRVVFRGVDWSFYDQLVDSIPEWRNIHVDYDGKDLEIMSKGMRHEVAKSLFGQLVSISAEESETPFQRFRLHDMETARNLTWSRGRRVLLLRS